MPKLFIFVALTTLIFYLKTIQMKKIAFSFLAVLMANLVSAQCDKCSAITAGYDGTTLTLLDGVCATLTYPVT